MVGSAAPGAPSPAGWPSPVHSVILLEAGKNDEQILVTKPGMIGPMHAEPEAEEDVDWGYYTTPAGAHARPRGCPQPAGQGARRLELGQRHALRARQPRQLRLLGGRGQHRLGRRRGQRRRTSGSRTSRTATNDYRGAGGPIKVTRQQRSRTEASLQFVQAAADTLGVQDPRRLQRAPSRRASAGSSRAPPAACATRRARLPPPPRAADARGPDPRCTSRKVVIENGRATGVEVDSTRAAATAHDPGRQGGHPLRRRRSARRSC